MSVPAGSSRRTQDPHLQEYLLRSQYQISRGYMINRFVLERVALNLFVGSHVVLCLPDPRIQRMTSR